MHVHTLTNVLELLQWLNLLALSIKGVRCSNTWRSVLLQLVWKTDKTVSHIGVGGQKGESDDGPVLKIRNDSKGVSTTGRKF